MPQTQVYTKKAQIAIVPEATVDTFVAATAVDVFLADIPDQFMTIDSSNYSPNYQRADFLNFDETPGPVSVQFKFRVPVKGSGTAGAAPEFRDAFGMCGWRETVTGGVSVVYSHPISAFDATGGNPAQSFSITVLENGIGYFAKGCFGNMVLTGTVGGGEPLWADVTAFGSYIAPAASALLVPTYQTSIAPAFRGAALLLGGSYIPKGVTSFSLDLGNRVAIGRDVNEASGVYGARITGGRAFGSIDPELIVPPGTQDYYALWRAGTAGAFTTGTINNAFAGNRYALAIPRIVRRPPEQQARDGIRALGVPFSVSSATTDVEATTPAITLTLT